MAEDRSIIDPDTALIPIQNQLSFDELLKTGVTEISQLEGHYTVVKKEQLIGVPFIIVDYIIRNGDYGTYYDENGDERAQQYASVMILTKQNENLVFNDGGVGIIDDLVRWNHNSGGLFCPSGLRKSEYTNKQGIAGETFYLG